MDPEDEQPESRWTVLVEEMTIRTHWHVSVAQPAGPDLARARETARQLAFDHRPMTAGRRMAGQVYQTGDDVWLVAYKAKAGLGYTYFKVSVVRHLGTRSY